MAKKSLVVLMSFYCPCTMDKVLFSQFSYYHVGSYSKLYCSSTVYLSQIKWELRPCFYSKLFTVSQEQFSFAVRFDSQNVKFSS